MIEMLQQNELLKDASRVGADVRLSEQKNSAPSYLKNMISQGMSWLKENAVIVLKIFGIISLIGMIYYLYSTNNYIIVRDQPAGSYVVVDTVSISNFIGGKLLVYKYGNVGGKMIGASEWLSPGKHRYVSIKYDLHYGNAGDSSDHTKEEKPKIGDTVYLTLYGVSKKDRGISSSFKPLKDFYTNVVSSKFKIY